MKRVVKKYIIPHEDNDHAPHLLRIKGFITLLAVIIGLFSFAAGQLLYISTHDFAAVLSPVLVDLTNMDRETEQLKPLKVNPVLQKAAEMKAKDMAEKGYFTHTSPEGLSPWYWLSQVNYKFTYAGENLAVNFTESADVAKAWMESPSHRNNIMNDKFTEIGIATAEGMYEGKPAIYVVQLFGKPAPTVKKAVSIKPMGQVKGEATSTEPVPEEDDVRVIAANSMFLAVEHMGTSSAMLTSVSPTAGTTEAVRYATPFQRALFQPRVILGYAYAALAIIITFVMSLIILSEFKRRHFIHMSYGLGLLVVMGTLMYTFIHMMSTVTII